jgi:hypothetical protein
MNLFDEPAQPLLHDRRDYMRAARELARNGLLPRDIAAHLRITVGAVLELLNQPASIGQVFVD